MTDVDELTARMAAIQITEIGADESAWELATRVVDDIERALGASVDTQITVCARMPPDITEMPARILNALCNKAPARATKVLKINETTMWLEGRRDSGDRKAFVKLEWVSELGTPELRGISADVLYVDAHFLADEHFRRDVLEPLRECSARIVKA
jgi:hypothetical protein